MIEPEKYPYRRTIKIPGTDIEIPVGTDEECEQVNYVLCVTLAQMDPETLARIPQMESYCMDCKVRVARDARGPKKPPSLCIDCLMKRPVPGTDSFPA